MKSLENLYSVLYYMCVQIKKYNRFEYMRLINHLKKINCAIL